MSTRDSGHRSEDLACFYLQAKGYHIVETNWRYTRYELDIVAFEPELKSWLFVEVKSGQSLDTAIRHFSPAKEQYICYAIESYLTEKCINSYDGQLDLIAISATKAGEVKNIDHITDVL